MVCLVQMTWDNSHTRIFWNLRRNSETLIKLSRWQAHQDTFQESGDTCASWQKCWLLCYWLPSTHHETKSKRRWQMHLFYNFFVCRILRHQPGHGLFIPMAPSQCPMLDLDEVITTGSCLHPDFGTGLWPKKKSAHSRGSDFGSSSVSDAQTWNVICLMMVNHD